MSRGGKQRRDRRKARRQRSGQLRSEGDHAQRPFQRSEWLTGGGLLAVGMILMGLFLWQVWTVPEGGSRRIPVLPFGLGLAFGLLGMAIIGRGIWLKIRHHRRISAERQSIG